MQDIVEIAETKSKEVQHKGRDVVSKAKEAGSHFFEKKSDVIDVHRGDTLWGISRKHGVSFCVRLFTFRSGFWSLVQYSKFTKESTPI